MLAFKARTPKCLLLIILILRKGVRTFLIGVQKLRTTSLITARMNYSQKREELDL